MQRLVLAVWLVFMASSEVTHAQGPAPDKNGWYDLFDGKTFDGWKAADEPKAFKVKDGLIVAGGTKLTHLYYVGPILNAKFKDFELKADVKTRPKGNSGIIFHTAYQAKGFPDKGFEFQINNTGSDKVFRTGSIYPAKPMNRIFVKDDEWFECHLFVKGDKVVLKVNGQITMDTTLPHDAKTGRTLGSGTFAIQGHDPGSIVYFRSIRVRPSGGNVTGGGALVANINIPIAQITHGTSNTLAVSEQSDYLTQQDGTLVDWNTGWHGWLIGTSQTALAGQPGFSPNDSRIFGLTSIRYQINQKAGWLNGGDCGGAGVCPNFGCNVPLNSTHPGGVNAAFCDGSVHFLDNSVPLLTLAELATRDDALPTPIFD